MSRQPILLLFGLHLISHFIPVELVLKPKSFGDTKTIVSMEPQLSSLGDQESQKEVFVSGDIKNTLQAGKQVQASSELVQKSGPTPTALAPPTDNGEAPFKMLSQETGPLIRGGNEK